jgi:hypothetical protein
VPISGKNGKGELEKMSQQHSDKIAYHELKDHERENKEMGQEHMDLRANGHHKIHLANGSAHSGDEKAEKEIHEKLLKFEIEKKQLDKKNEFKSLEELRKTIRQKEQRLEEDKEGIIDNLTMHHILSGIIPKALRTKKRLNHRVTVDDYFKQVARRHIIRKEDTFIEKVKEFLNIDHNGAG